MPHRTAHETVAFGQQLGLLICTTPVYSPESNGMAEAFVKSFKRDYAYLHRLESADAVMRQLPTWFDDYNEVPASRLETPRPRHYPAQRRGYVCSADFPLGRCRTILEGMTRTRRYVVIRTSKTEKQFVLRELEQGRLRQGWGYKPEYDLRLLRQRVNAGEHLDEEAAAAWRNRRLLDTEPDGLKVGDVAVLPNLPEQGKWVLARVAGPYQYSIAKDVAADYGHIVEVSPVRDRHGSIAVIEADNEHVDARLRASMRNMSRMWSIDTLGPGVEKLISAVEGGYDTTKPEPEAKKAESFFAAMRQAAWENIQTRYKGAEFELLVHRLFERIYQCGRVEHRGGPSERGADLIVFTQDPLGLEYKIAVQVKLHNGIHDDTHALQQVKEAREVHHVDAGVIVTTAVEISAAFDQQRAALEAELAIDVRVITRDELVGLLMTHLARAGV